MSAENARELLAQADRLKATADGAEFARTLIRLSEKPEARRGLLGFWNRREDRKPHVLGKDATRAVYEALATVRDDASRRAQELEARVEVNRDAR